MESLRQLYRIGTGPSSSHTMAPRQAALIFLERYPAAPHYRVTLFGSLAATGRGHLTDKALLDVFQTCGSKVELLWVPEEKLPLHPNGMRFESLDDSGSKLHSWEVYSVGGGALQDNDQLVSPPIIYPLTNMADILNFLDRSGESLWEYVLTYEDDSFPDFLAGVWDVMSTAIGRGLEQVGILPGGLGLGRKAHTFYRKSSLYGAHMQNNARVWAYALAVSEENASGGIIATAPTCGASGVLPAVLRYLQETLSCSRDDILRALATAGLVGNLVKKNASISGAEVGCQGEIGTACAMAAAAATQLHGGTIKQIEYAAEMGLEHHLGLTCDPVNGLVQIPCIERNAHAATRALSCCHFALLSGGEHKISFDEITLVMNETGQALPSLYRETSVGGIAQAYRQRQPD
ncbi:L-serine ammonia-lyase, iron-sulfur-dependent, subunit alpha [uncultured Desulfuromusa sp.]|uniref:L-serine ammonia-lyase, iron-sulfur-dependent, subunit alpha n=1 Tax=uncultured Desulfuromusa sp. TaxID=219183 RepID=UPI002AA86398|nr:L-serine ammonia-lyase, iron-sulfur-dependent, subunit alpha [uncultured Desulfuromusa sp.]